MLQFELVSRFPAPPDRVVALIMDSDYQQRMHTELGFKTWALKSSEDGPAGLVRKLRLDPPSKLPGFIQKAMANKTGYVESQIWQADRMGYTWSVAFDLSPKLSLSGTTRFEVDGDACVRTIDFTAEMKARLIGKKVEAVVKDEALKTQGATAEAMAEHLAKPAAG